MPGFDLSHLADGVLSETCHPGTTPSAADISNPANVEETARRHRYLFETLAPLDKESLLLFAYKITRPSIELDRMTVHNGPDEIYMPGKNRWLPIEVSFYERIYGNEGTGASIHGIYDQPAELIYKWWSNSVIKLRTSLRGTAREYKKPAEISMLDGLGNRVWVYYLANCWPTKVSPSNLSYVENEIADITATLTYDKAVEERGS